MIPPAHMGQGSRVTYSSQPSSRQLPSRAQAARMASNSAWAVASPRSSRRLRPSPMISPSFTMTQPTGTSPLSTAWAASSSARAM